MAVRTRAVREEVVLGVDIGTTATKVVAVDVGRRSQTFGEVGYPLDEPEPGAAVQDPELILRAVLATVGRAAAAVRAAGATVAGLSVSSAMHSLLALDAAGSPLTPSITWADTRAAAVAERLRAAPGGLELHRRTGTPLHPMAPLPKLVWLRETEPRTFASARTWCGIKEYVVSRLTGRLVTDHSLASGTGLLAMSTLDWDGVAMGLAGIDRELLPPLVPAEHVLAGLTAPSADALGLPAGTPLVVGAGDGPLANLGVGAIRPGVAVCSIGTSGALRLTVERPGVDPLGRVFCYALTAGRWVIGGAVNNGGVVVDWVGDALAPDLGGDVDALLRLAATTPPGSAGLVMLPYLLSERAPHWSALPRGAYVGLRREHRREHLVRAALEGVCQQLALVAESMREAGNDVREVRATGGFARSPLWRQMLTDVLGVPVGFPRSYEGSGFGAALLGMAALGLVDGLDHVADLVRVDDVLTPDPEAAAVYTELLPVFASLYDALEPTYRTLRRLRP